MNLEENNQKLVSIITPLYNAEKYIKATIDSVQNQTYKIWEMIIVDDCSKDNGPEIVKEYAIKDKRIKFIKLSKNEGGAVARNRAIKEAKGRYIAFLDSDDMWNPKKLKNQIKFMEENSYDFTYTWYEKINEEGKVINEIVKSKDKIDYNKLLKSNEIGCLTAIYNQDSLGKVFMPLIRKRQDYALWLQVLKKTEYGYCLKNSLAYYRLVKESVSSDKISLIKYNWNIFRKIEKFGLRKSFFYLFFNIFYKIFKNFFL